MRKKPVFNRKEMAFDTMNSRAEIQDGKLLLQVVTPTSNSEVFKVLISLDSDNDYNDVIGHDLNEENLGYVAYEVANEYEPDYVMDEVLAFYRDGFVPKWVIGQALNVIKGFKKQGVL